MSKLYTKLARVYHEMYQEIFDYKEEFNFYDSLLKKYGSHEILEIGCGSGNLASDFLKAGYLYLGLDLSEELLRIAKEEVAPHADFIYGDMRDFNLEKNFDAIIITGKSFCYLTMNSDIQNALSSIHGSLKKEGILIFDNFNAEKIISLKQKEFKHTSESNGKKYSRISIKTPNLNGGWTENWLATYHIEETGKETKQIEDTSIVRSFTIDEISLFLRLYNFDIIDLIEADVSFTIIARKLELSNS